MVRSSGVQIFRVNTVLSLRTNSFFFRMLQLICATLFAHDTLSKYVNP